MKKTFKRMGALVLAAVMTFAMLPGMTLKVSAADKQEVTGYSATELTGMFSMGFNIGNTFDATGGNKNDITSQERSWGNPTVNRDFIHGLAEAGFTIVRIPITWQRHISSDGKNTIDKAWLERIKTVVDYCLDEGMFAVINIHHDDTWLNVSKLSTEYKTIGVKLGDVWSQIADYFADYDQRLIFESMNEPRAKNTNYEWTGTPECYEAINYLNQVFVNTVRGNGKGHNGERALAIPGYAASNSQTVLESIKIPEWKGKQAENIIVAVHCYSPYNFCLSDAQSTFDPLSDADTSDILRMFKDMKRLFLDKGIAVYLGECGVTKQGDNESERAKYLDYFGSLCRKYGVPACVWDNGVNGKSGGENHSYINRKDGSMVYPEIVNAFVKGIPLDEKPLDDMIIDFENKKVNGVSTIKTPADWGFKPSTIRGQIRINHTPDVNVGYSAMIDSYVSESTAYLDISDFMGRKVKITAYLMGEAEKTVTVGLYYNGEMHELSSVQLTYADQWKGVGFAAEIPITDKVEVFFKSDNDKTYYIDDVMVEKVKSLEGITFDFGDEEVPAIDEDKDTTPEDNETSVSASTSQTGSTSAPEQAAGQSSNTALILMWVCIAVAAIAILVVIISVVSKKKK